MSTLPPSKLYKPFIYIYIIKFWTKNEKLAELGLGEASGFTREGGLVGSKVKLYRLSCAKPSD